MDNVLPITKQCHHCKQEKPATPAHFYRNKRKKDGLDWVCKDCMAVYHRENRAKHLERSREHSRRWARANKDRVNETTKRWARGRRLRALTHYSEGTPTCSCCGETHEEFLCIDHIGDRGVGAEHRKRVGIAPGTATYRWLEKNNYPDGFRVLCHNCNCARGFYGYCPHEKESRLVTGGRS